MIGIAIAADPFKCHMNNKKDVDIFFCKDYCMYYNVKMIRMSGDRVNKEVSWAGCFYDERKKRNN